MEEYTQITLDEWQQWKEDIRRKLAETASNFVYIGYRLKQIRDSGMYDGAADIFEFAQKEYGLGKSTVSRFIAINEKFSEGGNSLELKEEYRMIGSSKLAEMLTLTDAECSLITERTTVREIRELKQFGKTEEMEENRTEKAVNYTPLQECIIDYFRDEKRKAALDGTMELLREEPSERNLREAAEMVNPGEYATHRKGLVFLFLYDYNTGIKYKLMTEPDPVSMTWVEFFAEMIKIFQWTTWQDYYGNLDEEKTAHIQENQGIEPSVATSQQREEGGEKDEHEKEDSDENGSYESTEEPVENAGDTIRDRYAGSVDGTGTVNAGAGKTGGDREGIGDAGEDSRGSGKNGGEEEKEKQEDQEVQEPVPESVEAAAGMEEPAEVVTDRKYMLIKEANELVDQLYDVFGDANKVEKQEEMEKAKENAEKLAAVAEQIIKLEEEKQYEKRN